MKIVLPEATVRAMFPDAQCAEAWPDAVSGDYDPACCRFPKSCSVREATVKWITAPEPLKCETCGGAGEIDLPPDPNGPGIALVRGCTDCPGTGRPTVEIFSANPTAFPDLTPDHSRNYGPVPLMGPRDCTHFEDCDVLQDRCMYAGCSYKAAPVKHGTVEIGEAVMVIGQNDDTNLTYPFIVKFDDGDVHLVNGWMRKDRTDITGQFCEQDVTPGHWAHPLQ